MEALFTVENGIALITLTVLEIVLGIDNIVFLAIITGKLDPRHQTLAQRIGLSLAMIMRLVLLLAISWVMGLTGALFTVTAFGLDHSVSGRDLILLGGGLFLIAKATVEIHDKIDGDSEHGLSEREPRRFWLAIAQIVALDLIFSLDSVITAVGMARHIYVMIAAVVIAVGVMFVFAGAITRFVERHPTVKMLALSFLLLVGVILVADGLHHHIPKGYVYFALAFSLFVEMLNIRHQTLQARKNEAAH